ncbi:hypothetical protein Vadar_006757 [Vaccinium darrowii]|uniref:Uncharacterized protein n=1 Tax=Vaccinium darrowii TaxID=229202 RepID=A0ACB7YJV4_9ERIC|nr:hypothetical protein Vadar_006757 [Vaccinium darrowii]
MDSSNQNTSSNPRSKLNLTEDQRQAIFAVLLMKSEGGKLKRGCIKYTAAMFSVDRQTIRRIWQRGNASMANGLPINVCSKKPKAVGRKRVEIDVNEFVKIDRSRRTNIRSLSSALSVPRSVVHRRIKEGVIKPHTNAVKPYLN